MAKAAVPSFVGADIITSPPKSSHREAIVDEGNQGHSPVCQASDELSNVSSSGSRKGADESMRKIN